MKNKIVTRALSLLLALVCIMGVLPLSAFAAAGLSSAPGSITQKSSDYMKIGGRSVRYQAASSPSCGMVVKSMSRFARNTRDSLHFMRELMRLGVTVRFEKENIDTGKLSSEQTATIYAAFAQMESTGHSSNMRLSVRMRMRPVRGQAGAGPAHPWPGVLALSKPRVRPKYRHQR